MNSKECLYEILGMLNHEEVDECDKKGLLRIIKQDLNRLEQLEKALEILKEVCSLNSNRILETERNLLRLSKEEYELLKEVLE